MDITISGLSTSSYIIYKCSRSNNATNLLSTNGFLASNSPFHFSSSVFVGVIFYLKLLDLQSSIMIIIFTLQNSKKLSVCLTKMEMGPSQRKSWEQ